MGGRIAAKKGKRAAKGKGTCKSDERVLETSGGVKKGSAEEDRSGKRINKETTG